MAIRNYTPFQTGPRLIDGAKLNRLFQGVEYIGPLATQGLLTQKPQVLTATGSTQGGAALITSSLATITVATTASTHGVRLPSAATGLTVQVGNHGTFGVKVYPFLGDKIGAASTNAADTVLAVNKANTYFAIDSVNWVVNRGA